MTYMCRIVVMFHLNIKVRKARFAEKERVNCNLRMCMQHVGLDNFKDNNTEIQVQTV